MAAWWFGIGEQFNQAVALTGATLMPKADQEIPEPAMATGCRAEMPWRGAGLEPLLASLQFTWTAR